MKVQTIPQPLKQCGVQIPRALLATLEREGLIKTTLGKQNIGLSEAVNDGLYLLLACRWAMVQEPARVLVPAASVSVALQEAEALGLDLGRTVTRPREGGPGPGSEEEDPDPGGIGALI